MKCNRSFYNRDTCQVAQDLLGRYLIRMQDGRPLVIRITETEAYIGRIDKACHAYNYRRTARTETLFASPGTAYIYLIYGMYHCLNFVTEPEEEPCAVLIRGGQARATRSCWPGTGMGRAWTNSPLPAEALSGRAGKTVPGPGPHPGREWMLPAGRHPLRLRPAGGHWPGNPAGRPFPLFHHRRSPGWHRLCRRGRGLSLALSSRT